MCSIFSLKKLRIPCKNLFYTFINLSHHNFREGLNENHIRIIYHSIMNTIHSNLNYKIKIRENSLEKFLIKICILYRTVNVEIIENYLIFTNELLSKRIVEKIISEVSKLNDNFMIFLIVRMCCNKNIAVDIDSINIESDVLKNVYNFVIESTKISELVDDEEESANLELNSKKDRTEIRQEFLKTKDPLNSNFPIKDNIIMNENLSEDLVVNLMESKSNDSNNTDSLCIITGDDR